MSESAIRLNFCTALVGSILHVGEGNDPKYGFPHIRQLPRGGPPFHPRCTKRYTAFIPALQGEEAIEKARLKPNEQELLNKPSSEAQKVFEKGLIAARHPGLPNVAREPMDRTRRSIALEIKGGSPAMVTIDIHSTEYADAIESALRRLDGRIEAFPIAFESNASRFVKHPNAFMEYDPSSMKIFVNPAISWRQIEAFMQRQESERFYATTDPHHIILTEVAHFLHHKKMGDAATFSMMQNSDLTLPQRRLAQNQLGDYAGFDKFEFVAEFSVARFVGRIFTHEALKRLYRLFDRLNGAEL